MNKNNNIEDVRILRIGQNQAVPKPLDFKKDDSAKKIGKYWSNNQHASETRWRGIDLQLHRISYMTVE